jgi:hypothetical protein
MHLHLILFSSLIMHGYSELLPVLEYYYPAWLARIIVWSKLQLFRYVNCNYELLHSLLVYSSGQF